VEHGAGLEVGVRVDGHGVALHGDGGIGRLRICTTVLPREIGDVAAPLPDRLVERDTREVLTATSVALLAGGEGRDGGRRKVRHVKAQQWRRYAAKGLLDASRKCRGPSAR
jgi:hypothetical protein